MLRVSSQKNTHDVRETNAHPVVLLCSDGKRYICKHKNGETIPTRLFNEHIAYHFSQIWGLKMPNYVLVDVNLEHIQEVVSNVCQPSSFVGIPCFGLEYKEYASEFSQFLRNISDFEKRKILNKGDLLKIALFDIWLANEDRTVGNHNLIIVPEIEGNIITLIDHESCFNSNSLKREQLFTLSLEDSILYSGLVQDLLPKNLSSNFAINFKEEFYENIDLCSKKLDEIFELIPDEWKIEKLHYKSLLKNNLFNSIWSEEVFNCFLEHLTQSIKK